MIKQLKETAKSAGLPADAAESWLKSKAQEGKVDAEEMVRRPGQNCKLQALTFQAKQLQSKLQMAARFFPGQPKDVVNQVSQISPSLGKLLLAAMQQAEISDEKGNKK